MDHQADTNRTDLMTITRFVLNEQSKYPESRGDFTILLSHIVLGCKFVCSAVNKAGLAKLIGLAGETNVQGEEQKKLDVLSNEVFVKALISSGRTCLLVSEEVEEAIFVPSSHRGKYIVVFDPLDGSSNIDCGVSIGTIFGIYMVKNEAEVSLEDALQPGNQMLAAGYCMYGSSCTVKHTPMYFVLSKGNGVKFILTHPNIKIPSKGKIYSVNEGNVFILTLMSNAVWLLISIELCFMVASSCTLLMLLYEVFPMSYLMEQAGGQAFTGKNT